MMALRRMALVGSLIAVALAIGGLFALRFSQEPDEVATIDPLRLGAYEGDVGALEWIAKDKGFFQKVGLDVTLVGFPSGNAAVNAMRAGQVEVATAADLVVAKRSFDEPDLRVIADICRYWNKGLIGRKDRGIATPADLKGKRIGVPATSSAEHNLVVFLALQGLSTDQVTTVDLPPAKLVEAMATGTIDATLVWEPHVMAIRRKLGDNAVTLMDGGTEAHLLLVSTKGWLATQGRVARKLLRAMVMAEDWVAQNRDEAKAYLTRRFALDPDHVEVLWPRMQLAVGLPQEILAAMDSEARWLAESGNQTTMPDFSETVDSAALRAVKPSAVHVFTK